MKALVRASLASSCFCAVMSRATFEMPEPNLLAYHVEGDIDPSLPLIIDPDLDWGTFFDGDLSTFDNYLFAIAVAPWLMAVRTRFAASGPRLS